MRRAMAEAVVGDDDYREDPTVRALEEAFAERVGKASGLFVPSGTMANQIALRVLSRPGTAVVAGRGQHVVAYGRGAAALNCGVQFVEVDDAEGILRHDDVGQALEGAGYHLPAASLICIENTHMASSGAVWSREAVGRAQGATAKGVPVHLDGARLFNAEVATGISVADLASVVTTVTCCLSKGLCAPVGSVLAGEPDVMAEAGRPASGSAGACVRRECWPHPDSSH